MKSSLAPELLTAYLETDYFVSDDPPLLLHIGEENDDAKILLASFAVDSAAFITAWNPGKQSEHSERIYFREPPNTAK